MTVKSTKKTEAVQKELLVEVASISKRLAALGQLPCYTKYNGRRYYITDMGEIANKFYRERYFSGWGFSYPLEDSYILPVNIIKKMVTNGLSKLNTIESKVTKTYESYPEVALQSVLESKDKRQVVRDLYEANEKELTAMISSMQLPAQATGPCHVFKVTVGEDVQRSYIIRLYKYAGELPFVCIQKDTFMDMLTFINNLDEVKRQFKDAISKIIKGTQ